MPTLQRGGSCVAAATAVGVVVEAVESLCRAESRDSWWYFKNSNNLRILLGGDVFYVVYSSCPPHELAYFILVDG
jgi:hypothetical protein